LADILEEIEIPRTSSQRLTSPNFIVELFDYG
jgi:hypothetical protein